MTQLRTSEEWKIVNFNKRTQLRLSEERKIVNFSTKGLSSWTLDSSSKSEQSAVNREEKV